MGDNIVVVALECTGCNGNNRYHIRKNKKVQRDKLEIKKYCKLCNKHLIHKETKQGCSSVVEHILGKDEVGGSTPLLGFQLVYLVV